MSLPFALNPIKLDALKANLKFFEPVRNFVIYHCGNNLHRTREPRPEIFPPFRCGKTARRKYHRYNGRGIVLWDVLTDQFSEEAFANEDAMIKIITLGNIANRNPGIPSTQCNDEECALETFNLLDEVSKKYIQSGIITKKNSCYMTSTKLQNQI